MNSIIRRIKGALPSALLFAFTFFVFGPLQMYLTNAGEFWFQLAHILPIVVISFVIVLVITVGVSLLIPQKLSKYYIALVFGIGFALYIQGNFINLDYGILDGTEIDWSSYGFSGILNTVIWCICIVAPLVLLRIWPEKVKKVITFISLIIVTVQILTTGILLLNTQSSKSNITVTDDKQFSLSAEKNVVIFILDTFDASYMNEVLTKYPEYKNMFKDFTYYSNALGSYPNTKGALPHILTGVGYDNSVQYKEYIENAYDQTILYDTLISEGFDIGVYTNKTFISSKYSDMYENVSENIESPSSYSKLGLSMYKATAFSYFPHISKAPFWYYSGDFEKYKAIDDRDTHCVPYTSDDVVFYNKLTSHGLSFGNAKYAFRLYHLNGVHPPYTMKPALMHDKNGASEMEEALASLNNVLEYIKLLKESSAYNNTSIIIMADHGVVDMRQNVLFIVKPERADQTFSISASPVSYDDLLYSVLYMATEDSKYEPNVFTWSVNDTRTRRYIHYDCRGSSSNDYLPDEYEYITNGMASDISQMQKTGKVYTPSGVIDNYSVNVLLGESLKFGNNDKIESSFIYGLSDSGGTHTWSLGKKSKLKVIVEDIKRKDDELAILIDFKYIYGNSQRIRCYVNGVFIDEKTVETVGKPEVFTFSSDLIPDSGLLELELEYPDAFKDEKSSEIRVLAFAFENMKVDYAENILSYIKIGDYETNIDFSENGSSDELINEGWYGQESTHRWSSEEADITFHTEKIQDYLLSVDYQTYKHSGDTHILYNGEEVAFCNKNTSTHRESIILPSELYNSNGIQTVTFITDDAKSPKESGEGKDSRVLGIDVKSMTIEPYNLK